MLCKSTLGACHVGVAVRGNGKTGEDWRDGSCRNEKVASCVQLVWWCRVIEVHEDERASESGCVYFRFLVMWWDVVHDAGTDKNVEVCVFWVGRYDLFCPSR